MHTSKVPLVGSGSRIPLRAESRTGFAILFVLGSLRDMDIDFVKMHGIGNDFVMLNNMQGDVSLGVSVLRRLADRRHGVGCDQVLVAEPSTHAGADIAMRIYNADGTKAGQCGNGLRCMAVFARETGLTRANELKIETEGELSHASILGDGRVSIELPAPDFAPEHIPLLTESREERYSWTFDGTPVSFGAVSMGNPHAVIEVPDVSLAPVATIAKKIQADSRFPEGVNVGFMEVVSGNALKLRVYERGVGETQACGSGACAAVAVGVEQRRLASVVSVELPGGTLAIEWQGEGGVKMTGPAERVFHGNIHIS